MLLDKAICQTALEGGHLVPPDPKGKASALQSSILAAAGCLRTWVAAHKSPAWTGLSE